MFGVSTSAYQIEGALDADGRGRSIWENFAEQPNAIERGETAAIACDHYNRLDEDLKIISGLGVRSYRFSIAWPRIQPVGSGAPNPKGIAFYDRLVDGLLAAGIRPFPTLYHWDLPQALEDTGGWAHRDTADRFAEYAGIMLKALGDRVQTWSLFNEPFIFSSRGYLLGRYAPGRRSLRDFLKSVHVITLAHADGYHAAKAARPGADVGSVFAMAPCEPATDSPEDHDATAYANAVFNHLFLGPLFNGEYPAPFMQGIRPAALGMLPGDAERMHRPLDFIGVNCYYRLVLSAGRGERPDLPFFLFGIRADARTTGGHADLSTLSPDGVHIESAFGRGEGERTAMGWEIWPRALFHVLMDITREYGEIPIEVCESGCALVDPPDENGQIHDEVRIAYHNAYMQSVAEAVAAGARVRSYHAWSLYDNFEWASGYRPRFGLIHVDYTTQKRTLKASGTWFRDVCHAARNGHGHGAGNGSSNGSGNGSSNGSGNGTGNGPLWKP